MLSPADSSHHFLTTWETRGTIAIKFTFVLVLHSKFRYPCRHDIMNCVNCSMASNISASMNMLFTDSFILEVKMPYLAEKGLHSSNHDVPCHTTSFKFSKRHDAAAKLMICICSSEYSSCRVENVFAFEHTRRAHFWPNLCCATLALMCLAQLVFRLKENIALTTAFKSLSQHNQR